MDMSLDQIIKNEKKGNRARGRSSGTPTRTSSSSSSSSRRRLSSGGKDSVKFTARLDIDKIKSRPPRDRDRVRSTRTRTTTTTTTTNTSSLSAPPPLKITIQNEKTKKEHTVRDNSNSNNNNNNRPLIPERIKITKSISHRGGNSRPIINRSSSSLSSRSQTNTNNNQRGSSRNSGGSGVSLFERTTSRNASSGRNLQLFTGTRLNLSNLHHAITQQDLKVLFEKVGEIKNIRVNFDRSGRSDGTGFVVFANAGDAQFALQRYNGASLDGQNLVITKGHSLSEDIRNLF